ncbi:MAG TPA: hypothetical protein VGL53_23880 [Bryobacteraceae bacterium]
MPRRVEWIERLPAAIEELKEFSGPVIDRDILERVLRIHRRVAIRLMHRLGGFQSGKTFLIDRLHAIEQLERVGRGEDLKFERDRRARLAVELEEARRLSRGRNVVIDTTPDVHERVMKDLPPGIHLQPGELRIEFAGAEDLLRHLFELSQSILNDYERFRAAVENVP